MNLLLKFLIKINSRKNNKIVQFCQFCTWTILTLGSLSEAARADLAITSPTSTADLVNALTGQDIEISNVTINQGSTENQVGIFSGGDTGGAGPLLGIADGVILVTGTVTTADGPNTSISTSTGGEAGPTDSSLASIESGNQFDTVALQFNVKPAGNTLSIEFIFASEEYNEFVCTRFNDAMGIFVSGPGITGEVNIARLGNNVANFSINQINGGTVGSANSFAAAPCSLENSEFFVDNITNASNPDETPYSGNTPSPTEVQNNYTNVEYDGFTIPLASQLQVQPGQTYTIKIVTADIGDAFWDGGVFVNNINSFNLDYGDAPDSYGTSSVDQTIQLPGPARHSTGSSIYLGSTAPDAEGNGTPTTSPNAANGDDNTGVDDEDAFSSGLTISSGITSHTISDIPVNNTSSQTAQLMGWIDFNQDGDFLDAGEQAIVDVAPNQTTANLSWSGFSATTTGNTYARFRITADSDLINSPSPVGLAFDGEVEDYEVEIAGLPELLLVKRITAINPDLPDARLFSDFVDDSTEDDNNLNWLGFNGTSNTYTLGEIDGGQVNPGDVIEYTIYFLSNGSDTAQNVLVCDLIPENTEFLIHDFDTLPGAAGGIAGSDRGMAWEYNGVTESLTNGSDGDGGYYFAPGIDPSSISALSSVQCGATNPPNTNGAVVVDLDNLSSATAPGTPADSYGLIRFRVQVK